MLTSLSPSPSQAKCPQCMSPTGRFDRFCGICGTHLARLRWQPPGGAWQEGNGPLAVTEGATAARIVFENDGVVPLALILDDRALDALPGWIDTGALSDQELLLAPKTQLSLEIPLRGEALAARTELETLEALLSFLTSASDRPLTLTLVLARQPWVHPAASLYRFLPIERLREGIVHEIELHNTAAASIELEDISFDEATIAPPPGYHRISGEVLLRRNVQLPRSLVAGETWTHPLLLQAAELSLPEDSLGWFSTTVRYELLFNNERQEVVTRLSGAIGRGPTLELQGSASVTSINPDVDTQHSFSFRNPGQLPVEVQDVKVLRGRDGQKPAPDPDWLVLTGLAAGDVLAPGEERTLVIRYLPDLRPPDELLQEWNYRVILIRHDGWQDSTFREYLCRVTANFGAALERTLGIDFGTSNSVACLMGKKQGYPLTLEVDGPRPEQLASLMYFNDSMVGNHNAKPVLYGDEAKSAANVEPANLVRSIKTVVIDGARTEYSFQRKGTDGGLQHLSLTPQELLNLFIRQLRTQAEQGVELLGAEILHKEQLDKSRVVFRNAVFSHPVDVTDSMKVALMQASHSAGINTDIQTPEEFFEERCVDEATAAVLAYIYQLVHEGRGMREAKDLERILCVDIGGGTTDIAAVAVKDVAAFLDRKVSEVTVELWTRDGDRQFAGDALDRLLAKEILILIEQESREQGAPVLIDEVMRAMFSPSFTAYQRHFKDRFKSDSRRRNAAKVDPHAVYSLAARVLEAAETAKQAFASEALVARTFTGSGWPRLQDDPAATAKNIEILLQKEIFEEIVRRELGQRFHRLDAVIAGARWEWPSMTILLLTGQSMKSPIIRQPIVEYVREKMGEAAENLVVVEPGNNIAGTTNGFDPKACVALGAAIWGISRTIEDPWLVIQRPFLEQLTFDLTTKGGPIFTPVEGLQKGVVLPAEGKVPPFRNARRELILYRNEQEYVRFNFPRPVKNVTVLVESMAEYFVVIDGEKFSGEILQ